MLQNINAFEMPTFKALEHFTWIKSNAFNPFEKLQSNEIKNSQLKTTL
jgi:hypothetical protein